jgi:hypothetical protein
MGRMRWIAIAGVMGLIAAPAIALAADPQKPAAGMWAPAFNNETDAALGSFVVASSRTQITSLTFTVESQDTNPGCPTGAVSVPGPLELKLYKFKGTRPFWAFGKVGHHRAPKGLPPTPVFQDAPVSGTVDGQPLKGAKLNVQFVKSNTAGIAGDISGGIFDFSARCQATLFEGDSAGA